MPAAPRRQPPCCCFERPILEALIEMPGGRGTMRVLVAHLKSKRPKFLQNDAGEAIEDRDDAAIRRDVAYSHVHQAWPEVLDQIWVSEEFVASSRFAIGEVRRVEYFNDPLHQGRDRFRSDHGFVRAGQAALNCLRLLCLLTDGGPGRAMVALLCQKPPCSHELSTPAGKAMTCSSCAMKKKSTA